MIAALVAGALLVTVVMPAEYGIDPTGVGRITGLKQMGDIKMSLAQEAAAEEQAAAQAIEQTLLNATPIQEAASAPVAPAQPSATEASPPAEPAANAAPTGRSDEMALTLAPNEGAEIKVVMQKGEKVTYEWSTDGGKANFDVHGDSQALKIDYHNYYKGKEQRKEGVLEAAFDGSHGWFWRNRTTSPLTVTLKTSGNYTDIKKVK